MSRPTEVFGPNISQRNDECRDSAAVAVPPDLRVPTAEADGGPGDQEGKVRILSGQEHTKHGNTHKLRICIRPAVISSLRKPSSFRESIGRSWQTPGSASAPKAAHRTYRAVALQLLRPSRPPSPSQPARRGTVIGTARHGQWSTI